VSDETQAMADDGQKCKPIRRWPRWTTFASGRIYRPVMRLMHKHGWCFPISSPIELDYVWCHWCGMRGNRPESSDVLLARMASAMKAQEL
jgi:hypothetical protein